MAAGMVLVALATVGYVLPPRFDPPPLAAGQTVGPIPAQTAAELRPVSATEPISVQHLSVPLKGGEIVEATIRAPLASGRHPALVFVQGSGTGARSDFNEQAEWLAHAGVITLVYDKRTEGYSFRHRDFGLLADDALRMIRTLRQRADVDPARTGLWGVSEGTWVTPLTADAGRSDVSFMVMVSAPNVSPMRQVAWALNEQLQRLYAPIGVRDLLTRAMGAVGFDFLRYNAAPALTRIKQPVLALYGTADPSIPFVESARNLEAGLKEAGNDQYTIRFLDKADHAMRIRGGPFASNYMPTLVNWVKGLPGTAKPSEHMAGTPAVQRLEASDVPAAPWYARGAVLSLTLGLAVVGYVAAPVAEMLVRLRRGTDRVATGAVVWPPIRRRLRRMAWTGAGLLASVMAFITLLVLFSVNQAGAWPAVLSGWLVIRVLALLMLVQEVTAVSAVVTGLREGWRPTRWQKIAVSSVLGSTGLLLVAAGYYGLFAFPWW
ncbi:hypothetical protein SAMN05421505_101272 [Sinosporangium album]|uniref:Peptidase S9 prolyl oligopeptidase catalytic domain-containing protein n=1 Tax=Sinosporangium album TaxID=504805 RepID=A0A1G7R629_9ACTN|nr:prolyl oligopeptidase family serine peptidase [Sinosporangium album]SDG06251.1 hypothetical protein SAMN05421505_101272 [Sinosporangium album]